jgi:hypothetical protein
MVPKWRFVSEIYGSLNEIGERAKSVAIRTGGQSGRGEGKYGVNVPSWVEKWVNILLDNFILKEDIWMRFTATKSL